jgi:hypothetical protein
VLVPTDLTEAVAPSGMVAAGTHALARRQERHAIAPAPREPEPEPVWELERQSGEVELPTEPDPLPPLVPASEEGELPVLPRRRSRRGHAVPQQPQVDWPAERDVEEAPEQAGQWMNAFLSGAAAANGELDLDGTEQLYQSDKHDDQPHGAENSEDLR